MWKEYQQLEAALAEEIGRLLRELVNKRDRDTSAATRSHAMLTRLSICMLVSMLTSVALADGGDSQASAQDTSTNQSGNDLASRCGPDPAACRSALPHVVWVWINRRSRFA